MEIPPATADAEADAAEDATAWDWGSLFDFTIEDGFPVELPDDDPLLLSWEASSGDAHDPTTLPPSPLVADPSPSSPPLDPPPPPPMIPAAGDGVGRVRKRDPRLVCPNYLAGIVPCSCPELDEMAAAEEQAAEVVAGAKKRVRTGGAAVARCQVPGCETDISELKGYHKRHRVCLRCANASSVVIDGEHKRYCQQCGKFHILPDFDEGKRSCRRKLERHNKRRRRRPSDLRNTVERETEDQEGLADVHGGGEPRKEISESTSDGVETAVSSKVPDEDILLVSEDGHGSPIGSLPCLRNNQSHSTVPLAASVEVQIDEKITNAKSSFSSTLRVNKSAYSSTCPTGRISFKLYDWNPAEFPRRLRHQIFQWLENMPVELEGYIRPGCTILTIFIAMPHFMWEKLSLDVADNLRDLVNAPDSLFLGRGTFLIYLSNMIVQVLKDGTSLMNVKMEVQTPRLHYIYPAYFEAGKPMEFVVCGSNLEQPKFRLLVSFSGKYLKYDCCRIIYPGKTSYQDGTTADCICNPEHEMLRIRVPSTDAKVLGPAFVEVENVSGISNFVPLLIGNKQICSELERMEEAFGNNSFADNIMLQNAVTGPGPGTFECLVLKQAAMSALLLDIGWLLKDPSLDQKEAFLSSINIQRICSLLKFVILNELSSILEIIVHHLENVIGSDGFSERQNTASEADITHFHEYVKHARGVLCHRIVHHVRSEVGSRKSIVEVLMPKSYLNEDVLRVHCTDHGKKAMNPGPLHSTKLQSTEDDEDAPLVTKNSINKQRCYLNRGSRYSLDNIFSANITRTRLALFVMVVVVMCLAACVVILHPHQADSILVSIRKFMSNGPMS